MARAKQNGKPRGELLDRQPPANTDLERELLATLLKVGPEHPCYSEACRTWKELDEKDFYDPYHAWLFVSLKKAREAGVPICSSAGFVQWAKESSASQELKRFGCTMADLPAVWRVWEPAMGAHFHYYRRKLRELRKRRAAVWIGLELLKAAYNDEVSVSEWVGKAEQRVSQLKGVAGL